MQNLLDDSRSKNKKKKTKVKKEKVSQGRERLKALTNY